MIDSLDAVIKWVEFMTIVNSFPFNETVNDSYGQI